MQSECPHTQCTLAMVPELGPDFGICPSGAIVYKNAHVLDYGSDYFLSEYENQYGKTYIDDEGNLRMLARRRLEMLRSVRTSLHSRREFFTHESDSSSQTDSPEFVGKMLEIGCATGFFLDEARKAGLEVKGIEVSPFATRHATEMGLDVANVSFLDDHPFFDQSYDCLAAFFVLEHLPDQKKVFAKLSKLLKPGGILLFSLPSTQGPLFHCNPGQWIDTHPPDHFIDYSPASLKAILGHYDMKLKYCRPCSYHQQRACGLLSLLPSILYRKLADLRCFGDTFEGIIEKIDTSRLSA